MNINTNTLVSITEANQNFSRVARLVDENGSAVILKNNVPRYLIIEFGQAEKEQLASDEDVMAISKRLITRNRQAYEELAYTQKELSDMVLGVAAGRLKFEDMVCWVVEHQL